jgi:subtilase family serine protease
VTATFLSEGAADQPDLTGTITKFRRKVNSDGDKAVIKVTIENLGTLPAEPFSTTLFVSDDMVWDVGDAQVATVVVEAGLLPGERVSVKLKSTRLANLVGKFILTVIDANNNVEESAEVNNVLVRKLEGVPDLRPTITKFKHTEGLEGDKQVVKLTVRNRGTAAASEFSVALFLSDDATLDPGDERLAIATVVDGVASGKKSGVVKLKRKGLPPMAGKFVIVVVDADDGVFEANEGNNTLVVPIAASGTS